MTVLKTLSLQIPGSTSNVGPGFDSFALALSIYCKVHVSLLDKNDPSIPFITFKGAVQKRSQPDDVDALLYRVLNSIWKGNPDLLRCIRIEIESEVPLGCGLGGSSAAILGGLWGSYVFQDRIPNPPDLLAEATQLEGHGEGFAASLLGDFVVCARSIDNQKIIAKQLSWPERWRTIFVIPSYRLNTENLRSCLPGKVSHADAIFNIQRAALLVAAIAKSDESAMREALYDRMHESYRGHYNPLLAKVRTTLQDAPTIGCCLSGAGPSVMVITHEKYVEEIVELLTKTVQGEESSLSILDIRPDREGLRELAVT